MVCESNLGGVAVVEDTMGEREEGEERQGGSVKEEGRGRVGGEV